MVEKVRLGLIGTGRIGRIHAYNLRYRIPKAELVAVVDIIEDAACCCANELGVPVAETDCCKIFERDDIDAVVICCPTNLHADLIEQAAAAGKHIFCEKPIALEIDRTERALAAVEEAGVKLQVGFNRRFDPSFRKAQQLIKSGEIGTPHIVRITSRDPGPPPIEYVKVSGGLFADMMIHDFDMARFLLGDDVKELVAYGDCLVDPAIGEAGDIDTAIVVLKYENGAMGAIDNSRKAVYGYDQRIEIHGSKGTIIVGNKTPTEVKLHTEDGISGDVLLNFFIERYQESFLAEMEEFIECVLSDKEPSVSGIDGLKSLKMAYAALESLKTGSFVNVNSIQS
ncbi:MAG: inositol 2-dehydrogenase [Bacillota bacterium]|jgi:myo-inositol 2-dehydrogenase/D-chiro-inositol 1-dehydrogenase|nr:inositol 2-dehydrogenase [Bacillota bacterium]MDI9414879.1 inositol 2-dehydrogenase [Bacillota bacterium]HOB88966.1 inositol 2-dehydrogenase [Bacillota bacterium]HOJ58155.1 inositol 2-dehydrogenase [Bacillota bacterium]HOL02444.1 inositol 2-dehydrogenase [Bacillota bacterium]